MNTPNRVALLSLLLLIVPGGAAYASESPEQLQSSAESERAGWAEFQAPRLVESSRPPFSRMHSRPQLVSYPGMPASERPGPDWTPEYGLWTLKLRVDVDENGQPSNARVEDNPLSSQGMVRRYERLALRAVENWRFAPAQVDGRSVASDVVLAFHFDTALGRPIDTTFEGVTRPATAFPLTNWRGNWRLTNR